METPNTTWSKEALIAYIQKKHDEYLRTILIDAENFADADASTHQADVYATGIRGKYDGVLATIRHSIQAETAKAHDTFDNTVNTQEDEYHRGKLAEARDDKRIAEADRRKVSITYDWKGLWWRILLEIFIFTGEVSYNSVAFAVLGGPLLFSIVPALVLAISMCAIAMWIPQYLKNKSEQERKKSVIHIAIGMFFAFAALAILRSLSTVGDGTFVFSGSVVIGAVVFIVLNAVMFVGAVLISAGLPSKEDRLAKREHDRLTKKIAEAETTIDAHERAYLEMNRQSNAKRKERITIVGMETHFADLIKSRCNEAIHEFYKHYFIRKPKSSSHFLNN
jgi:hypothetical protein